MFIVVSANAACEGVRRRALAAFSMTPRSFADLSGLAWQSSPGKTQYAASPVPVRQDRRDNAKRQPPIPDAVSLADRFHKVVELAVRRAVYPCPEPARHVREALHRLPSGAERDSSGERHENVDPQPAEARPIGGRPRLRHRGESR